MKGNSKAAIAVVLAAVLLAGSFLLDGAAAAVVKSIQSVWLTGLVAIFEKFYFWIYIALFAVTFVAILKVKTKEAGGKRAKSILSMAGSIIMALSITYILKPLIHRVRPDGILFVGHFGMVDYSFPSGHTTAAAAGAFSAPALRIPWLAFMAATMFSRVYTNVHFLSDTVGALIISFAVAEFVKSRLRDNLTSEERMEIRRQAMHCLIGIAIAVFVWKYSSLWYVILIIAAAGIALSYSIKSAASAKAGILRRFRKLAVAALQLVERKADLQRFPGKGAILLFVGSAITAAIFGKLAVAPIIILAVGDSVSHLAGRLMGKTRHRWPFDKQKTVEGSVTGFVAAAAAATMILPVCQAVFAAGAAMIIEAIDVRLMGRKVDDNLTAPLAAAAVLWIAKNLIK